MNYKAFIFILVLLLSISAVSASNTTDISTNDIQNEIDRASDGDTVNLGDNKAYNIENDTITISKGVTLSGNNVTITAGSPNSAIEILSASNVKISGITFINPIELPEYGTSFEGEAIYTRSASNIVIENCKFINYRYGVEMYTTTSSTIKNCWFNGQTINVGASETGTKAIQLMGSKNINIINNTFEGQLLDGLSIASGSGNVLIENNTFINNTYAIYYGGASSSGSKIKNNTFITCGYLKAKVKILNQYYNITYDDLPFISLQKSSDNLEITGNTFTVKENNTVILSEAENTAHGYPSVIGSINITDNTVKSYDTINTSSVIFYYLKVLQSLAIQPTGDIIVQNNDFSNVTGINHFKLEFSAITDEDTNVLIPKAQSTTYMSINYVKDGRVIITLYDSSDSEVKGESISYTVNGGDKVTSTTDEYGHVYIDDLTGENTIRATYKGSDSYISSYLTATIKATAAQDTTAITASDLSVYAASAKSTTYTFTLKSGSTFLADKTVSVSFNGKIYNLKSNANGVVSFKIPTATAGKYYTTLTFTGDTSYTETVKMVTLSVKKQPTKLTVAKKTFKKSATKKVTAVLKDSAGKVIKSKKVTLKVNGKTYKATTNAKGVATFTVKLTKKGTFTATTKFAGDSYYTAKSVTSKIVVK